MRPTETLRQDHGLLRKHLNTLEGELKRVPKNLPAVRLLCHSLARAVDIHMRKEETLLAPFAERVRPEARARMLGDHADEWMLLHELDVLFAARNTLPTSAIVSRLADLIKELRDHLDMEEREIFSAVDRTAKHEVSLSV